jgi:hypothetical protein
VPPPLQALASPGGETALDDTLVSISPVQTLSWCLHHSAAAVRIPAVALPTGRNSLLFIIKQNAAPVNPAVGKWSTEGRFGGESLEKSGFSGIIMM